MKTGESVSVDTGMILMLDPCLIFTAAEWRSIRKRSDANYGGDIRTAIKACLVWKNKRRVRDHSGIAVVHTTHGDGTYDVSDTADGKLVEGA